jgi:DNA processing protein
VGSRASTAYGEHVTAELAYGLATRSVDVVSGGAYGIDAVAHRSALAAGGQTLIVSAGGLDRPYPAGNASLYERASASGLLISESPPGAAPQRHRFLTRNRLIATLSTGTIVVEAAVRSGALNTARHCQLVGRTLMVVPGPVTSAMSAGCHALLRRSLDPAVLVTSVDDVLAVVGSAGEGLSVTAGDEPVNPNDLNAVLDQLDPTARLVFDAMPVRKPAQEDELARRSGISAVEVIRALPLLRLARLIESTDEGFRVAATFRKRQPPRPSA